MTIKGGTMDKPRKGKGVREVYYGGKQGKLPRSYWKHEQDKNLCILPHVLPGGAGFQLATYLRYLDGEEDGKMLAELWNELGLQDTPKTDKDKE